MAAAAGVLIAIGIGTWMAWPAPSPVTSTRTFATKSGQQMTITLAQDARVTLAPATTLRVSAQRIVLDGEAYFQIAPHSDRAITILTPHAEVRVLGTRFGVRAYAGERTSRVVVEDGKVALRALHGSNTRSASAVATARMLAVISDSGVTVTRGIAVGAYTEWTQGRLSFDDTPLGDVMVELARAYGTKIRVEDSTLALQPLTMAVSVRTEPLGDVLTSVGQVAGAHVTRRGDVYVLVRGRTLAPDARIHRFPPPERQYGK
jgi:transmembrane sensor